MPFVKIVKHVPPCMSSQHNPPSMIVLPAGAHTWKCPACGHETTFTVGFVCCSG